MIGVIGNTFGKHNVNIAAMNLGRQTPGGEAIGVLNLDTYPPAEAVAEAAKHPHISSVSVVKLPAADAGVPARTASTRQNITTARPASFPPAKWPVRLWNARTDAPAFSDLASDIRSPTSMQRSGHGARAPGRPCTRGSEGRAWLGPNRGVCQGVGPDARFQSS